MLGKIIFLGLLCLCFADENAYYFRSDYTYENTVRGWLKFHKVPVIWSDAREICHAEGATVAPDVQGRNYLGESYAIDRCLTQYGFRISSGKIIGAVLAAPLTRELNTAILNQVPDWVPSIYIGVHSKYAKGMYVSIEGVPISEIKLTWAQGEPNNLNNAESCLAFDILLVENFPYRKIATTKDVKCSHTLPFVCYKKFMQPAQMNTACGTRDFGYQLDSRTNSCYKFHRYGLNWNEAYRTCMAEQAHLVIINNAVEAQVIKDVFAKNPEDTIFAAKPWASIGTYLDVDGGYWLTIHGQTPVEAGYNTWQPGEPNNGTQPRGEFCGVTHRNNGYLHDAPCDWVMPFICEKEPGSSVKTTTGSSLPSDVSL